MNTAVDSTTGNRKGQRCKDYDGMCFFFARHSYPVRVCMCACVCSITGFHQVCTNDVYICAHVVCVMSCGVVHCIVNNL